MLVDDVTVSAPAIAFFRLALGVAVVGTWVLARGRARTLHPGPSPRLLVGSGIVLAGHWALQFEAFKRLEVAAAILIVFLGPVLMTAFAPLVLGERVHAASIAALAAALAGIALITVPGLGAIDGAGVAAALGSAVLFAVLVLVGKTLSARYEPPTIVVWQQAVAALALAPALVGVRGDALARDLVELVVLGVALTGILSIVFFHALRALKAQQVSVLFYLEPASAVVYAWLLLGQQPAGTTLAGGALIVAAGVTIIMAERASGAPASVPAVPAPEEV